ncbi:MAG: hypothetical protein F4W95_00525 [Chloroflexi bacterium]|nr:hypothetical protein [Chloroflexota bacterium]MYD46952.1 hypothetical protein [Chloroflexota bacterium]
MAVADRIEHPLLDQISAYEEQREELEMQYHGKWVVMHDGEVKGDYDTYDEAVAGLEEMGFSFFDCLVRQVGVEPAIILSFGS